HGALWAHERMLHTIEYARTGNIQAYLSHTEHNLKRSSQWPFYTESAGHFLRRSRGRKHVRRCRARRPDRTAPNSQSFASIEPFLPKSGRLNANGAWQAGAGYGGAGACTDGRTRKIRRAIPISSRVGGNGAGL